MAMQRTMKYQYETSPRKLQPEYRPIRKKYPKKSTAPKKKVSSKTKTKIMKKNDRAKLVMGLLILFIAIFTISYRSSKIDASFTKSEEMKQAYLAIQKQNDQIKVDIENSLNLNNIEQAAKEKLGMQKLSNKQTIYVNLLKEDYIQPALENSEQEEGLFDKILRELKNMF